MCSDDMNFDVLMFIFRYPFARLIPEAFSDPKSWDFLVFGSEFSMFERLKG